MDFEIAVVDVSLAREQRFQLAPRRLGFELMQRRFGVGYDVLIVLGFAQLDQRQLVVKLALDARKRAKLIVERGTLAHQAAGALRVVPKIRVLGLPVQLVKPRARLVDVKDASAAIRRTA